MHWTARLVPHRQLLEAAASSEPQGRSNHTHACLRTADTSDGMSRFRHRYDVFPEHHLMDYVSLSLLIMNECYFLGWRNAFLVFKIFKLKLRLREIKTLFCHYIRATWPWYKLYGYLVSIVIGNLWDKLFHLIRTRKKGSEPVWQEHIKFRKLKLNSNLLLPCFEYDSQVTILDHLRGEGQVLPDLFLSFRLLLGDLSLQEWNIHLK